MKKVLIKYKVMIPGFFSIREIEGSEIVDYDPGIETLGEVVERDQKKWDEYFKNSNKAVTVSDYKIIE
ncbi:MAG: hypothetical protein V4469_04480 [Patescibacteria group bacterium]